jgi:hypothetical protein
LRIGKGSAANASGCGRFAVGNKAKGGGVAANATSGVSNAVGVGAGDTSSVAVGAGTAFLVPKTNSSIALPSCLRFSVPVSTLPGFPQTFGCTLSQNMRQAGRPNLTP